jgi:superfamily II DNA helicase RecQ
MKIKTFHIRLSKEYIKSDEEKLNNFLKNKEVINTFAELVKTEKINFWSIIIAYSEQIENKNGKITYSKDTELTEQEQIIFESLKQWRTDTAARENVPQFVIAHDRELITIAKQNIENINDLKNIKGFGEKKIAKYGEDIIALLNSL